jgi:hypothetical protein
MREGFVLISEKYLKMSVNKQRGRSAKRQLNHKWINNLFEMVSRGKDSESSVYCLSLDDECDKSIIMHYMYILFLNKLASCQHLNLPMQPVQTMSSWQAHAVWLWSALFAIQSVYWHHDNHVLWNYKWFCLDYKID